MNRLTISQVARQVQLRSSAIRYYERIGLLPVAERINGQRRYDRAVLYRLALIRSARELGFTLTEIQRLFFGFRRNSRPSERWRTLSAKKLVELDHLMNDIKTVRSVIRGLMTKCRCDTLEQCGKGIFRNLQRPEARRSFSSNPRSPQTRARLERFR
jgi:MerR family transcriptional regulator, redox-sensitive transcriptional activator SoxR